MPSTLTDWIQRYAIPFSLTSPESFNPAVDQLIASLGNSIELLAFGEALHGGEEILILRNRIFQRLVQAHGYSAIALESSFPRGNLVNQYIAGQSTAAREQGGHGGQGGYDTVRDTGFSHNFGQLEANRELVEWMRQYNADPSHSTKLHFYGFDSPTEMYSSDSPRALLHFVLDYLDAINPAGARAAAAERRHRIDSLLGPDADWENPAAIMDPAKSIGLSPAATALRIESEDLITDLHLRRPELVSRRNENPRGEERYLQADQHACVARQLLNYHAALARQSPERLVQLLSIRDLIMADNLACIVTREQTNARGNGKVFAFAHNSHLKRGQARWQLGTQALAWWAAGAHLKQILGTRYAVIGSAVRASDANGIDPPEPGSLEAQIITSRGAAVFISTHQTEELPASEIAALTTRSGSPKNPSYMPLTPQSLTDFDYLAVLDSTTYTRGGPPLPT